MSKKFNLKAIVDVYIGHDYYGKNTTMLSTEIKLDGVVANSEQEAISKVLESVPFNVKLEKGLIGSVHEIDPKSLTIV